MTEDIPQVPADHPRTVHIPEVLPPSMPFKVAFVIDDEVVDILHTDERLASILLSNPIIVDASNQVDENNVFNLMVGSKYEASTQTFTNPF